MSFGHERLDLYRAAIDDEPGEHAADAAEGIDTDADTDSDPDSDNLLTCRSDRPTPVLPEPSAEQRAAAGGEEPRR